MFGRVKSSFFQTKSLNKSIKQVKENVLKRNSELDFELLGRSLSCNPFMPREIYSGIYFKDGYHFLDAIEIDNEKMIANDLKVNNIVANTLKNNIDLISYIRHYSPYFIIHKDIIISKYQILESLVYGSDCVILSSCVLNKDSFLELFNYAIHLGLNVAIFAEDKDSIKFANDIGINLFILQDSLLKEFIANNKIIIDLK
ncbi:hypothetical protein [Helicobacter sp. MIT 14-3879]|uniref:hypothetical protein n=1 Tax=Helicobacter sp. MIT 14-3879 TaxID=2040649 RepID=UPI000E1EA63F|nr:hypothetical protein [Helicobacter sp. MIT 14-3879]RDU65617.1 hypothetical protein CQA44_01160 [Helicobacter sp. MIT 14-3879]